MIARGWLGGALLAMACAGCNILLGGPDYKVTTTTSGATGGATSGPGGTTTTTGTVSNGTSVTGATVATSTGTGTGTGMMTTSVTTGTGNPLNPVQITNQKGVAPSGLPQSQHIIYAENGARYWFFFADPTVPSALRTRTSPDFLTWADGPNIPLPYDLAGDSRTFSVAYANLGMSDVVHIAVALHSGNVREVDYVRGLLTGSSAQFTLPLKVTQMTNNPSGCDPEEPGIALDSHGVAHIISGWWNNTTDWCDFNLYDATTADMGGAMFSTMFTGPTHQAISGLTNVHAMIPFLDTAMAFSDSGDVGVPDSSNVNWSGLQSTSWTNYNPIFQPGMGAVQSRYDWSACGVKGGPVDVVRRIHDNAMNDRFEHMISQNGWGPGSTVPQDPGLVDAGIVLLRGSHTLGLFTISAGGTGAIRFTTTTGGAWNPWKDLVSTMSMFDHLAGSGCVDTAHPTLVWTESGPGIGGVFGVSIASLLP